MIISPRDAVPRHAVWSEITDPGKVGGAVLRGGDSFTAAECAEIAKAYRHATIVAQAAWDNIETHRYDKRHQSRYEKLYARADSACSQWVSKFKEWETMG